MILDRHGHRLRRLCWLVLLLGVPLAWGRLVLVLVTGGPLGAALLAMLATGLAVAVLIAALLLGTLAVGRLRDGLGRPRRAAFDLRAVAGGLR